MKANLLFSLFLLPPLSGNPGLDVRRTRSLEMMPPTRTRSHSGAISSSSYFPPGFPTLAACAWAIRAHFH